MHWPQALTADGRALAPHESPTFVETWEMMEKLVEAARRMSVSPAQVMLSWGVQRGTAVIPKTVHEDRMRQNLQLVTLSDDDMYVLNELHKKPGMHRSLCGFHSSELGGSCFGWTYEMLGWDMIQGGVMRDRE
ncbi:hypothetical protein V5O48_013663 [Marasmius crinis-equi]|uniref:NADP-dependent oxidoreductase domain-containing protein n=1 Tax=Marasmius crinis-equi TaxID=585013 RepID=A0ABR3EZG6_9AGAR